MVVFNVEVKVYAPNSLRSMKIVGGGDVTDDFCAKWLKFKVCLNTVLHERIGKMYGKDFKDMVFVRKVHHWCMDWNCPLCYRHGSSVREARKIEGRLEVASKQLGLDVEHFIVSSLRFTPEMSIDVMYKIVEKGLADRGIIGAVLIPHGYAKRHYDMIRSGVFRQIGDEWRFHIHALGFLSGGYDHCRGCRESGVVPNKEGCRKCGGFEFVTRKCFETDGLIVKVAEDEETGLPNKRESVYGTAWYQLHHAVMKVGKVGVKSRSHIVRWYGVVSYRKLHVKIVPKKEKCPICKYILEDGSYGGVRDICVKVTSSKYVSYSMEHLHEDGKVVWFLTPKKSFFGSGYYED